MTADWEHDGTDYEIAREAANPDADRATLEALERLGLNDGLITRVRNYLEADHTGTVTWADDIVPWLPVYRLDGYLRRFREAVDKRPGMYLGPSGEGREKFAAEQYAALAAIDEALDRRRQAGDVGTSAGRDIAREHRMWVNRHDANGYGAADIVVLEGLEPRLKRPDHHIGVADD